VPFAAALTLASASASDLLQVPGGKLVHKDCVHEVPSGTTIEETDSHFVFTFPDGTSESRELCHRNMTKLGVSHGNAWKAWAQFKLPGSNTVTSLSNSWIVPETPTSEGALLYYWNGIEDGGSSGGGGVLQPVLQHASGGSWGIKSWYVGTGGTVTSGLVPTPAGSKVVGSMVQNSDGTWTCTGAPEGGESATLNFNRRTPVFTYAYEVLEAYSMGDCSMYPPQPEGVRFTDTKVAFDGVDATDQVQWVPYSCPSGPGCTGSTSCGEKATVDGGDVIISYRVSSDVLV